jgi:hypothetical protein
MMLLKRDGAKYEQGNKAFGLLKSNVGKSEKRNEAFDSRKMNKYGGRKLWKSKERDKHRIHSKIGGTVLMRARSTFLYI